MVLHGGHDPCNDPSASDGKESLFGGSYARVVSPGLGHFPQRQATDAVLEHLMAFLQLL